jgi:hypothetical protein
VWALRENQCHPQSPLYHAPFPNIYPNGAICFGQNHPPAVSEQSFDDVWKLFLDAPFNRDLCSGKSVASPTDITEQLRALVGTPEYPLEDLVVYHQRNNYSDGPAGARTLQEVTDHFFLRKEKY